MKLRLITAFAFTIAGATANYLAAYGLPADDPGVSVGAAAAAATQGRVAATVQAAGFDALNKTARKDTAYHVTERAPMAAKASKQLGSVRNEVASTLLPGTRYHNIVNIGCGWASGVNFTSSYNWPSLLQSILSDPAYVYDILTSPQNMTRYQNRYASLVKEALEARDGTSINLLMSLKPAIRRLMVGLRLMIWTQSLPHNSAANSAAIHSSSMSSAPRISFAW